MSLLTRGTQRALSERFGVSQATISRDVRGIYSVPSGTRRRCPFCGAKALDKAGIEAIENGAGTAGDWLGISDRLRGPRSSPKRQ